MKRIIQIIAIVLTIVIGFSVPVAINASEDDKTEGKAEVCVAAYAAETTEPTTENTKVVTTKVNTTFKKYSLYVKTNTAKVYSKPTSKAKVVNTYCKGKKVTVIGKKGNWRKIKKNKWIHKDKLSKKDPMGTYKGVKLKYNGKYNVSKNPLTPRKGVVYFKGHKETYYSQRVLPGNGLKIPGRHVATSDGTIRDKDGYIVVAINYLKKGSKIMTSLGPARNYDRGDMTGRWIDIYTDWS